MPKCMDNNNLDAATRVCTRYFNPNTTTRISCILQFPIFYPLRVVSLDKLVLFNVLLDLLQLVAVDDGVAPDTDTCCQLLHELAHRFVLATRCRTRNAHTPQDRGVDSVAVASDDLHAQRLTRVHNVSCLIHCKREEDTLRLHFLPHEFRKVLLRQVRI